jgi:hypothetical protein
MGGIGAGAGISGVLINAPEKQFLQMHIPHPALTALNKPGWPAR